MRSKEALLESTDPRWIRVAGMIRRMVITLTTKVLWQLAGHRMSDGSREITNAEAFTGIGFYSRPPNSGEPEAIVVSLGDASAQAIVATRDEKTRAEVAGELKAGETAVYTDKAIVYVKDDGTAEIRSSRGTAIALPTLADYNALREAFNVHTHFVNTAGGPAAQSGTTESVLPADAVGAPAGTLILKAE